MSRKKGPVGQPTMASEGKLHTKLLEDLWAQWSNMKIYEGYEQRIIVRHITLKDLTIDHHNHSIFFGSMILILENGPRITLFVPQVCVQNPFSSFRPTSCWSARSWNHQASVSGCPPMALHNSQTRSQHAYDHPWRCCGHGALGSCPATQRHLGWMDSDSGVDGKDPASFLNVDDVNGLSSEKTWSKQRPRDWWNKHDQVLFHVDLQWICWHCCIFHRSLYVYRYTVHYLHVNVTGLYHPTIQWSSFSFFGPKKHPRFWLDTFYRAFFLFPLPHLPSSPWLWCSSHKPRLCVGHHRKEWPTNLRCRPQRQFVVGIGSSLPED